MQTPASTPSTKAAPLPGISTAPVGGEPGERPDPRSVDELVASGETLTGEAATRVRAAIDAELKKVAAPTNTLEAWTRIMGGKRPTDDV
jgi:hypothetical protein